MECFAFHLKRKMYYFKKPFSLVFPMIHLVFLEVDCDTLFTQWMRKAGKGSCLVCISRVCTILKSGEFPLFECSQGYQYARHAVVLQGTSLPN